MPTMRRFATSIRGTSALRTGLGRTAAVLPGTARGRAEAPGLATLAEALDGLLGGCALAGSGARAPVSV